MVSITLLTSIAQAMGGIFIIMGIWEFISGFGGGAKAGEVAGSIFGSGGSGSATGSGRNFFNDFSEGFRTRRAAKKAAEDAEEAAKKAAEDALAKSAQAEKAENGGASKSEVDGLKKEVDKKEKEAEEKSQKAVDSIKEILLSLEILPPKLNELESLLKTVSEELGKTKYLNFIQLIEAFRKNIKDLKEVYNNKLILLQKEVKDLKELKLRDSNLEKLDALSAALEDTQAKLIEECDKMSDYLANIKEESTKRKENAGVITEYRKERAETLNFLGAEVKFLSDLNNKGSLEEINKSSLRNVGRTERRTHKDTSKIIKLLSKLEIDKTKKNAFKRLNDYDDFLLTNLSRHSGLLFKKLRVLKTLEQAGKDTQKKILQTKEASKRKALETIYNKHIAYRNSAFQETKKLIKECIEMIEGMMAELNGLNL